MNHPCNRRVKTWPFLNFINHHPEMKAIRRYRFECEILSRHSVFLPSRQWEGAITTLRRRINDRRERQA
jgi:hypothetical protein